MESRYLKPRADYNYIDDEIPHTLLIGLYERFKQVEGKAEDTPYDFEVFAAKIMEKCLGGKTEVTKGSGENGVDIMHYCDGLYLGQVKCYAFDSKVDFSPIAIIDSNIKKQKAKGGYVITTSDFSENAKKYAEGLNIQLINGIDLVHYWLGKKESWINRKTPGILEQLFLDIEQVFKYLFRSKVKSK